MKTDKNVIINEQVFPMGIVGIAAIYFIILITLKKKVLNPILGLNVALLSFSGGANGKESICQYRRHRRLGLDPWVRKIPWSRKQEITPVFLPGEFHGQRNLVGYGPWGHKQLGMTERTHTHTNTRTLAHTLTKLNL